MQVSLRRWIQEAEDLRFWKELFGKIFKIVGLFYGVMVAATLPCMVVATVVIHLTDLTTGMRVYLPLLAVSFLALAIYGASRFMELLAKSAFVETDEF